MRQGELFLNLFNGSDDVCLNDIDDFASIDFLEPFLVPKKNFKLDTSVQDEEELYHLLSSLRYWGVDRIPFELIDYCIKNLPSAAEVMLEFSQDLKYLNTMFRLASVESDMERFLITACGGHEDLLDYLFKIKVGQINHRCKGSNFSIDGCLLPAIKGWPSPHMRSQKFIDSINSEEDEQAVWGDWGPILCYYAAARGHLGVLRYAHEHGCPWNVRTTAQAALHGQLQCLKYAHENGCKIKEICAINAAKCGHLPCLRYLHEIAGCALTDSVVRAAVQNGRFDCVRFAVERGAQCSSDVAAVAAGQGCLLFLQFLLERCAIALNADMMAAAAGQGHLECMKYILHLQLLRGELVQNLWAASVCASAARHGYIICLAYAHEHGCPWDARTPAEAARNGHMHCLQYAHEHDCPWNSATIDYATENQHSDCLQYAIDHGCPIV